MKTPIQKHLILITCAAILTTAFAQAQTLLFRDDFTRSNNTDLNASVAGQSGALSPLSWVEIQCDNGAGAGELGDASIVGSQLRLDAISNGGSGAVVYPDQNFTGLTSLTVTMNIDSGGSGGEGRHTGFGIGYTKAALDGKTSAALGGFAPGSDVFIAYDTVGGTTNLTVREDNTQVFIKAIPALAYPVEYKIVFTFANMNDGTPISYEVFENNISILMRNGLTTWTGTNQNYIGFGSNYTLTTDIEFIDIQGTIPPPAAIVKANNTDNLNLGTSWVGGTAPVSGNIAKWDLTVDNTNTSALLGADVTWGGIVVQDPGGPVTIGGANTLSLDGLGKAVDLSTAGPDLTVNANLALAGGNVWDVGASRTVTAGGVVSGSSGIDKQGDGTVILSGANTYAGATAVTAGTLKLGAADVIPNGIGKGSLSVEGTLDLNGNSATVNELSGAGIVDNTAVSTPGTISAGANNASSTFNGVLQDTGAALSLTKIGTGTLTLGGANTYSGATTVSGGNLAVSNLAALGSTSGVSLAGGTAFVPNLAGITTSAPFTLGAASTTSSISVPIDGGTMTLNGVISGDGDLVITDFDTFGSNTTGIILLGAASTYTGKTTIATGAILGNNTTLRSGVVNALPTSTVLSLEGLGGQGGGRSVTFDMNGNDQTLAGLQNVLQFDRRQVVTSTGAATLTVNNAADFSFGGVGTGVGDDGYARIQGAISLVKSGAGIFSLDGTNTNTGNTTINQGELRIGNAGTTGILNPATDITIASGATFGVNRSNAVVQGTDFSSNPLTGDGNFAQRGTGSTTLNIANTYNGTTTVDAGTLVVAHASALGSTAAGTVVNGTNTSNAANAKLELSGGVTVTGESLTISGTGNFLGALTSSSGSNVWAGPVTIGLANTRLGASAGASLEVNGVIDSGVPNTGLVIRCTDITSSVILSGANTYSGSTTVSVGKLKLDVGDNRLPIGTTLALNSATATEAEFDLNGRNQQVAGLNQINDVAKNSVNNSSLTPSTLTVDTAATFVYGGILKGNLAITKAGSGTLTLSGTTNSHSGNTTVNQGILSIGGINTGVSNDASTVTIASGATLNLTYVGTDTVDKFFIGATQKAAGVYGALSSGAQFEISEITGTGTLTVTSGPPTSGFAAWQSANNTTGGRDEDHDDDGVDNGTEHFIYGPVANSGFTPLPGVDNNAGVLSVTWTKAIGYTGSYPADFVVETSDSLAGSWNSETLNVNVVITGPNNEFVTYTFPGGPPYTGKKFARLKVTGP